MSKKKNVIIVSSVVLLCIIIAIGSFFVYRNHNINVMIDKGIKYIDNKNYEKAVATFDLVLNEKSNDEKAIVLRNMINKYLDAKNLYDNNELDKANYTIGEIKNYSNYKGFKDDVNLLKKNVSNSIKNSKSIDEKISKIRALIDEKKYSEAKKNIDNIEKEKLNANQKQQVSDLKGRVDSELDKEKSDKKRKEKESKSKQIYSIPMSIAEATRYINDKLGKSHNSTYYYMNSDVVSNDTCYRFKENQNVGVNGPNYIVDSSNGNIWVDGDDDGSYVVRGNIH